MDADFIRVFEEFESSLSSPLHISSAYRCEDHNADVRGSPKSQHLFGRALDIRAKTGFDKLRLIKFALANDYSFGIYKTFLHIDCRPASYQTTWRGGY